jgi:hypothetical protein
MLLDHVSVETGAAQTMDSSRPMRHCFRTFHLAATLAACLAAGCASVPSPTARPDCITAKYIENLNRLSKSNRMFELKGVNAKIFLALDPRLLTYTDVYSRLVAQDIDELIAWKIRRDLPLATAVPFAKGCAVSGYGEPDEEDKLRLMYQGVVAISKNGIDDASSRAIVQKLVLHEYLKANETKTTSIIERVRRLLKNKEGTN